MKRKIDFQIEDKIQLLVDIANLFDETTKKCRFGKFTREIIFLAYFDMNIEYTKAITLLIKNKQYGVSLALIRLHLEILLKGIWSLRCATEIEVEKINQNKFKFASISKLVADIDKVWGDNDAYLSIKSKYWSDMCDYTHTGNLQLSKRFTDGKLKPNYSDEIIFGVLDGLQFIIQEFILHLLDVHKCRKEFDIMLKYFEKNT